MDPGVGGDEALAYAESRNYTEPLFVFVVMVVGLTIIANAPNPAGVALLRASFEDGSIGMGSAAYLTK